MITFDEVKRQKNLSKHAVDLADLTDFFEGTLLTREDTRSSLWGTAFSKCRLVRREIIVRCLDAGQ